MVRSAIVAALTETSPEVAGRVWGSNPQVELTQGMIAIGAAAHRGQPVEQPIFDKIYSAASKAPLAAEPYLVRGVQAQLAGDAQLAERAFQAAERRDPRSLPAHYFLADRYLREGDVRRGLTEFAALARLTPNGIASVTPYVASYARDPARWPQLRALFRSEPVLQENALEALAADAHNAEAVLALADSAHRNAHSQWLPVLLTALVREGEFGRARSIWANVARVPSSGDLLFDAKFANDGPPPPFNWDLTSSTVGLAERQSGGRLHVIFYGQEDGPLATQLLVLPPGHYRLAMHVSGTGPEAKSLQWSLTCAGAQAPFTASGLDALATRPLTFEVPAGCPAQRLSLTGSSTDMPQQVDVTVSRMALTRVAPNG